MMTTSHSPMTNMHTGTPMPPSPMPGLSRLDFEAPRRFPFGPFLSMLLVLVLSGWMISGNGNSGSDAGVPETDPAPTPLVQTVISRAQPVTRIVPAEGETRAWREATIRAQIQGTVATLHARKGQNIAQGAPVIEIADPGLASRIREAETALAQARREADNARALAARGLATQDRAVAAETALASAEARLATLEEESADRIVRAPFSGRLETLDAELGDLVSSGTAIARILDLSRISVAVSVPQARISLIDPDRPVEVTLITGEVLEGRIDYIATRSDSATRAFDIEVGIPNPQGRILAGVSASVAFPGPTDDAHEISTAYLSLLDDGQLAVKTHKDGHVVSYPVSVVTSNTETVWVTGLPERVEIITAGQGFVRHGDPVRVGTGQ